MSGAIIIGAQTSARLVTRVGVRPVLTTGLLLATGGFVWLAELGAASGYVSGVLGGSLLTSLGMGLSFTPLATAATAGVPMHQAGLASGVLNTSRQVGGSLGLAILATIATDRTHALLSGAHTGTGAALTAGYDRAFLAAAVVMLVAAAVAALAIPALRRTPEEEVRTAVGTPTPVLTD
jgi:MFS family permease